MEKRKERKEENSEDPKKIQRRSKPGGDLPDSWDFLEEDLGRKKGFLVPLNIPESRFCIFKGRKKKKRIREEQKETKKKSEEGNEEKM